MHVSNACMNCVASFKSKVCTLEDVLQSQEQHHVVSEATYWAKMFKSLKGHNSLTTSLIRLACIL